MPCHSQLCGTAPHFKSRLVSAHWILLPMATLRVVRMWGGEKERWKKNCFTFCLFPPQFACFARCLRWSASREVERLVQWRLSLQVTSCCYNRSPNNANIWNAERNCSIFYLSRMKDWKSVITDKKYADISIKSSRLYVCFNTYSADCCHIIFEQKI